MKLVWTRFALEDMRQVYEYIAEDNDKAARKTISIIEDSSQILKKYPDIGRTGRCKGTRELIVPRLPYIIAYRIKGSEAHIVSVIHTAMKWPDILPD